MSNPSVKSATFQKIPNQVRFALDGAGKPDISGNLTNIAQGDVGDCYFLATLLTVAALALDTILNMVHDNADGTCTVSSHSKYDGKPDPVTVTSLTAAANPSKMASKISAERMFSWAALIEKAWAAANSRGKLVSNSSDKTVVVGDQEGGQSTLTFAAFQSTNINQYIAIST